MTPADFRATADFETLRQRSALLSRLRAVFEAEDYVEVTTPQLSRDVIVDAHLEPFAVNVGDETLFLQTSPEFAMKRLLACGADAIYEFAHAFRSRESGQLHNPEFLMLEWYRVDDSYVQQMAFTERLVRAALDGLRELPPAPFPGLTYDEAFERATGVRVLQSAAAELVQLARSRDVSLPSSTDLSDRDELLNILLAELVEPTLGQTGPEFLYDYPATQAALARVRHGQPSVAERFELYLGGVELCNGYQELTDADELERRVRNENARRERQGLTTLPVGGRLVAAMRAGLPECSGVALGVDRLVCLGLGLKAISQAWPFPIDRA